MHSDSATIAIVGRPNVGKSTLFNRLIGKRLAITAEESGTTRDRISQTWICNEYETLLVDTGGLQYGTQESIEADVQAQARLAIDSADLIFFVIDGINNLTAEDFGAAELLRKSGKEVILIANKVDNPNIENNTYNTYELGFGAPVCVSAIHKTGIEELCDLTEKTLKKLKFKKEKIKIDSAKFPQITVLGRPNAGKSSLINAFLGSDKIIVSDVPGTTRDSIDSLIEFEEHKFILTDTAGLRRPGKIERGVEKFSALRAVGTVEKADIVVLLIDGEGGIAHQDCAIAEKALKEEKGLILVINKIDLLDTEKKDKILGHLRRKFAFTPWAPVVFISAKDKKNIYEILKLAEQIIEERKKRIDTHVLNSFLQKITQKHLPASAKLKKPKFFYGSQVEINPPTFTLFFRNPESLHFSYPRYLENEIRKEFGFNGTAIKLKFKGSANGQK